MAHAQQLVFTIVLRQMLQDAQSRTGSDLREVLGQNRRVIRKQRRAKANAPPVPLDFHRCSGSLNGWAQDLRRIQS